MGRMSTATLFDSAELVLLGRVDGPVAHPFVAAGLIVALVWGALRWLDARREAHHQRSDGDQLGLGGLLVWLAIFGVALAGLEELAGWPAQPMLPDHWPSWIQVQVRSEEHTSELQSLRHLVCRLLLEKKNKK